MLGGGGYIHNVQERGGQKSINMECMYLLSGPYCFLLKPDSICELCFAETISK